MAAKLEHKNSKIELLSPKQNGSTVEDRDGASKQHNKQSIKSMWKNAFKSLKTKDKDKNRERGDWERDKDKEGDKYSKQSPSGSTGGGRQSSIKRLLGSRQGSKKNLMRQDSDDYDLTYSEQHSRQSSIKKGVLRRKGSKEEQMEDAESLSGGDPDPIFATLKMASACRSRKDDPDGSLSPPLEGQPSLDYGADMIFMRSAVKQTDRYAGKVTVANSSSSSGGRAPMLRQQSSQQTSRDYGM